MTTIEAMKQWAEDVSKAYDILSFGNSERALEILSKTRTSLRQAITTEESLAVQEPVAWDANDPEFDAWWNGDYDDSTNGYEKDSAAYWAWAGWKAAKQKENT